MGRRGHGGEGDRGDMLRDDEGLSVERDEVLPGLTCTASIPHKGCWLLALSPQLKQRRYHSLSRLDETQKREKRTQREKTERAARCNHSLPTFLGAEKGGIISAVTCK